MASSAYRTIRDSLRQLYLEDNRPWLVGYSGGKDSTMVASLIQENRKGATTADSSIGTRNSAFAIPPAVVERDKASEGLLAAGDPARRDMVQLIEFRETLLHYQDLANGKCDSDEYACSC